MKVAAGVAVLACDGKRCQRFVVVGSSSSVPHISESSIYLLAWGEKAYVSLRVKILAART
jgi:hypothetical protein